MRTRRLPPALRQDDRLVAPPASVRRILARVLTALPCQTTARATLLQILLRRARDGELPRLARLTRSEVSAQRQWVEILATRR